MTLEEATVMMKEIVDMAQSTLDNVKSIEEAFERLVLRMTHEPSAPAAIIENVAELWETSTKAKQNMVRILASSQTFGWMNSSVIAKNRQDH